MLKINLLPATYRQRRLTKYAIIASVLLALITAGSFVVWNNQLKTKIAELDQQIAAAMPDKNEADRLESEANTITSAIKPLQDQVAFCDHAVSVGTKWAKVLENAAEYTHAGIPLTLMEIRGSTLVMQGHTPNLRTAARYLLNALRNPEWASVGINGPPGYPGSAPSGFHSGLGAKDYALQISVSLKNTPSLPSPPGGAVSGGSAGAGGTGGGELSGDSSGYNPTGEGESAPPTSPDSGSSNSS